MGLRVVLDTSVIVSALRSRNGASFQLVEGVIAGRLTAIVSAPLVDEYAEVLKRPEQAKVHGLDAADIDAFIGGFIADALISEWSLEDEWVLKADPEDAMVAQTAYVGRADHLVTHNIRDFAEVAHRISVLTPGALLRRLRNE